MLQTWYSICVTQHFCMLAIKNSCPSLVVHVCLREHLLAVCWAQIQQNATGMRISVALPWQQRNARGDGSGRVKAQRSPQQGKKNEGPD